MNSPVNSPVQQNSFISNVVNGLQSIGSTAKEVVKLTAKTALNCIGMVAYVFSFAVFLSMFFPVCVPTAIATLPFFGKLAVAIVAMSLGSYFSILEKAIPNPNLPAFNVTKKSQTAIA